MLKGRKGADGRISPREFPFGAFAALRRRGAIDDGNLSGTADISVSF